jgi:hypothetical protein
MQNFNPFQWVTKWVRQIKEDFYESENYSDSMIDVLIKKHINYEVCLRCGRYSKVDLCKQCDY